ncbi:hypothetical protein [Pedobacter heparinus]|uniref:Uncharacterized protein n=1 Tax=Pedobacter heparinus (strain ATCC 13125 / DSM 2366 / CIP 104194 / JCM 7457 / NBRC 12017 / NCIMB 9290 / NRRL B-14731 / HIM 762-3) TaxID=485917 RepID=C6Y3N0_PEDHD|nr:hypothetical protein [Pedobacter heparinus]ACU03309.1 hypothetical protein Phep_1091 [Pedobacter heparinus DSM 2366]
MKYQLIMPSSIDHLRNAIIDKLMAISDKDYLTALNKLIETAVANNAADNSDKEELPKHVVEGIKRGQADMQAGRSISLEEFKQKLAAK